MSCPGCRGSVKMFAMGIHIITASVDPRAYQAALEKINLFPLPGIEQQFFGLIARSIVTIATELFRLL
jgi:hypothetical protein